MALRNRLELWRCDYPLWHNFFEWIVLPWLPIYQGNDSGLSPRSVPPWCLTTRGSVHATLPFWTECLTDCAQQQDALAPGGRDFVEGWICVPRISCNYLDLLRPMLATQESPATVYTYCGPCGHPRVSGNYLNLMWPMWPPKSLPKLFIPIASYVAIQEFPVTIYTYCGPCGHSRVSCEYLELLRQGNLRYVWDISVMMRTFPVILNIHNWA